MNLCMNSRCMNSRFARATNSHSSKNHLSRTNIEKYPEMREIELPARRVEKLFFDTPCGKFDFPHAWQKACAQNRAFHTSYQKVLYDTCLVTYYVVK